MAGGLSGGALSGIVIAILLVGVLAGLAVYVLWIKNQGKPLLLPVIYGTQSKF